MAKQAKKKSIKPGDKVIIAEACRKLIGQFLYTFRVGMVFTVISDDDGFMPVQAVRRKMHVSAAETLIDAGVCTVVLPDYQPKR